MHLAFLPDGLLTNVDLILCLETCVSATASLGKRPSILASTNMPPTSVLAIPSASLKRGSSREQRAINSIDDGLCRDLSAAEEASVEAFDGVLAALDTVEFEVNVTCGVLI